MTACVRWTQQAIDVEAFSINPFWYARTATPLAKYQHPERKLAELCAARPERFVAFATVALQHPDLAIQQLETASRSSACAAPWSVAA